MKTWFQKHTPFALAVVIAGLCLFVLALVQSPHDVLSADGPTDAGFTLDRQSNAEVPGVPAEQPDPLDLTVDINNNCRYGVAALGTDQAAWIDDFSVGWWLNFNWNKYGLAPDEGTQYVRTFKVKQVKDAQGNYLPDYETTPSLDITDPNDPAGLRYWLDLWPGRLWIIGNEVDRGPDPGKIVSPQGDIFPDMYARAYHDAVAYIKQYDPTAKVAVSGLVQVTPGRLQYLDLFWEAHVDLFNAPPYVDVWTFHIYLLPEVTPSGDPNGIANVALGTDLNLAVRESGGNPALCNDPYDDIYCFAEHDNMTLFAKQVVDMRTWMAEHGQRDKPLLLTEYSLLYPYEVEGDGCFLQDEFGNCFTPQRVKNFMTASFNYLETATNASLGYPLDGNRLVQQWLWFSINHGDGAGSVSNLVQHDGQGNLTNQLTEVGQLFQNSIGAIPLNVNLKGAAPSYPHASTGDASTVDVDVSVTFVNNGNQPLDGTFSVTFYSDSGLTNPIGTASITPAPTVLGCGQQQYRASVTWTDLTPGRHRYWAKVDSTNAITESNEGDNVLSGYVLVDPEQILLPVIDRR